MTPLSRTLLKGLLGLLFLAALAVTLLAVALFLTLRAAPGEWSHRLAFGPARVDLSVLGMIRAAAHPLGMRALEGRRWTTSIGTLRFSAGPVPDSLRIVCNPCSVDSRALALERLRLPPVEWTVQRSGANDLHGDMRIGEVPSLWQARLRTRDLELDVVLTETPVAAAYAVFRDAIPEAASARIGGRVAGLAHLALPSGKLVLKPRVEGFTVNGLGIESLASVGALPACAKPIRRADASALFGPWLPRAVVVAEDPRFFEHPGYDLAGMTAPWNGDASPRGSRTRVVRTLSQRLAGLLLDRDEPTLAGALRELLFAVELDRELGKPRVLTQYLARAPWGAGQCGADAASLHWFGKRAVALGPLESAWLASLLRDPADELRRAAQQRVPDRPRMKAILSALPTLSRPRRKALIDELETWTPPVEPATR